MKHCSRKYLPWRTTAIGMLTMVALLTPPGTLAAATRVVDADGFGTATDCDAASPAFSSIQDAVNGAAPGDTIFICPGTYDEQVVLTTDNITIQGSGAGSTILKPTAVVVNSTGVLNPFPVAAIILFDGVVGGTVRDLTVDGSVADQGAGNFACLTVGYYSGLYYRNSSGTVDGTHITEIGSASRCTSAVNVASGFDSAASVVITDNLVDHYGNIGLNCGGPNSICNVTGNTFSGLGPIEDQIQAGMIFRLGAGGTILGNSIVNHFYTPAVGMANFSVGVALFNAEPNLNPHLKQTNVFTGNQHDVQRQSTAQAFE